MHLARQDRTPLGSIAMRVITLSRKYLAVLAVQSPWPGVRTSTAERLSFDACGIIPTALDYRPSAMLRADSDSTPGFCCCLSSHAGYSPRPSFLLTSQLCFELALPACRRVGKGRIHSWGKPTFLASSPRRESERNGSSKKSVFNLIIPISRSPTCLASVPGAC
jgi:hypothetical protein